MSTQPRLWPGLLKRETGLALSGEALLAGAAALLIAWRTAPTPSSGDPAVALAGGIYRFDIAALFVIGALLVLRTAARIEADHIGGWMDPLFAAGASRVEYALALIAASFLASVAVFTAAAVAFAAGIRLFADSAELMRALPRTIGGGVLLLAVYAGHTGAIGLLLRRAVATVVVVIAAALLPFALMIRHVMNDVPVPGWLHRVAQTVPPLAIPVDPAGVTAALVQLLSATAVAALVASRLAGRRR